MNEEFSYMEKPGFLRELEVMDEAKNYNDWIFSLVSPFIGVNILEIGCGIGTFTCRLLRVGSRVTALDLDVRCTELTRNRCQGNNLEVLTLPAERIVEIEKRFDTILLINVLEHIKDDYSLLSTLKDSLDGRILIFVPAFQCLYGRTDAIVGHHRRYSKRGLSELVRSSGYEIEVCRYFNSVGFFAWFFLNRILRQPSNRSSNVNLYDRTVVPTLRKVESRFSPPFGQSLFLVGRPS